MFWGRQNSFEGLQKGFCGVKNNLEGVRKRLDASQKTLICFEFIFTSLKRVCICEYYSFNNDKNSGFTNTYSIVL